MLTGWNDIYRMFGAMDELRNQMSHLLASLGSDWEEAGTWGGLDGLPRVNMYDTGDAIEILAELPGLGKDDINVRIQGNYLEISGRRRSDAPEGYSAHRVERGTATFSRSFTLPAEVDADRAEATLKDGVLTLVLPKSEAARPKQIAIQ